MLERVAVLTRMYTVIPELIINFDQTAVHYVPKSMYSYCPIDEDRNALVGADDKRQITAVIASSYTGVLLPPQLIFEGKTTECHAAHTDETARYKFHLTHSENHWSSDETMEQYFKFIILPYIEDVLKQKNLSSSTSKAIVMLDCWSKHVKQDFRDMVRRVSQGRILLVYIPPRCTSKLQVADVALNYSFKCGIRTRFEDWATEHVMSQLEDLTNQKVARIDISMGTLKPLMLKWVFDSWFNLSMRPDLIKAGWKVCTTDILDPFNDVVVAAALEKERKDTLQVYDYIFKEHEKNPELWQEGNDEDEGKGELDVLKKRIYGKRKSSRAKKPTRNSGYQIASNQVLLDGDKSDEDMGI
jgi:hypothetical protein